MDSQVDSELRVNVIPTNCLSTAFFQDKAIFSSGRTCETQFGRGMANVMFLALGL